MDFINARPKPLALYAFSNRDEVQEQIMEGTSSGGVGINLVISQLAVSSLPFGGIGASGMGRYHGEFSMQTFSHEKAVLSKLRGPDPLALARLPRKASGTKAVQGSAPANPIPTPAMTE